MTIIMMTNQMLENAGLTMLTKEECVNTVGGTTTVSTFQGSDGRYYTSTRTEVNGSVTLTVRLATVHESGMAQLMQ